MNAGIGSQTTQRKRSSQRQPGKKVQKCCTETDIDTKLWADRDRGEKNGGEGEGTDPRYGRYLSHVHSDIQRFVADITRMRPQTHCLHSYSLLFIVVRMMMIVATADVIVVGTNRAKAVAKPTVCLHGAR